MAQQYTFLGDEAIAKLCSLVRESHSVADAIDDESLPSQTSTYSSLKIQELLGEAGMTAIELTKAEYDSLSDEEKNNDKVVYFVDNEEQLPEGVTVVTELNDTATDDQVPTAKAIYDSLGDLIVMEIISLGEFNVSADSENAITVDISKEGYKPICATLHTTGNAKCYCYALRLTESETINAGFHNVHSATLTISPLAQVVYKKL